MHKDRSDIGNKWLRENYGERLKFVQDTNHKSIIPMNSDKNVKIVNDVEECTIGRIMRKD